MEALSFLKFWRPTGTTQRDSQTCSGSNDLIEVPNPVVDSDCEVDEGDDSFFELELTLSDFDNRRYNSNSIGNKDSGRFDSSEEQLHYSTKNATHNGELKTSKPTLSMSSSDVLSKRKILPIEPSNSKPQSPMALLKSAPKLRVSIFKKSKSTATAKTDHDRPKQEKQENNKLFTVKFKVEEVSTNLSMFSRACSLRKTNNNTDDSTSSTSYDASSKRFSKDAIQKYLKLIMPLYVKASKQNEKMRFSGQLEEPYPATLPSLSPLKDKQGNTPAGFRISSRHLGKSKSASATATVSSPARRDDSLLLQHDGIQSAILHCKKSFQSSRDSSSLSRSTSSSSQETFCYLSSKESPLFPRFSSDSSCEGSVAARKSNEGV